MKTLRAFAVLAALAFVCAPPPLPALQWNVVQPTVTADLLHDVAFGYLPDGSPLYVAVGTNSAAATVYTSPDGIAWTARPTGIGGIFHGVAYRNDLFIAVGETGAVQTETLVATSPDGVTWTDQNATFGGRLYAVTRRFNPNEHVAVGGNSAQGIAVTSPAGTNWSQTLTGVAVTLHGVDSSGGTTVAAGTNGIILRSLQGDAFTPIQPPVTADPLNDVLWSSTQGIYLACGQNGRIVRSINTGVTWTVETSNTADVLYDLAGAGDLFVAVGTNGRIITSPNGAMWTVDTPVTATILNGVTAGTLPNGHKRFVAVGQHGQILWADHITTGGSGTLDVTDGTTSFNAAGGTGTVNLAVSGGPVHVLAFCAAPWVQINFPQNNTELSPGNYQLSFTVSPNGSVTPRGASLFVHGNTETEITITQAGGVPLAPVLAGSVNGNEIELSWNSDPGVSSYRLERRINGGGPWLTIATLGAGATLHLDAGLQHNTTYDYRLVAFNPNGASPPSNPFGATIRPAPPAGLAVTLAGSSTIVVTWNDVDGGEEYYLERREGAGGTWKLVNPAPFPRGRNEYRDVGLLDGVEYFYRMRVRSGPPRTQFSGYTDELSAAIPVFTGTAHWGPVTIENPLPTQPDLAGVAFGGGKYVAVGAGGTILGSPDGVNWTAETSGNSVALADIAYGNGLFTAVGADGTILTSPGDGTWTARTSGTTEDLVRVAFGGSMWVAASTAASYTSPDAVAWTRHPFAVAGALLLDLEFGNGKFLVNTLTGSTTFTAETWTSSDGTTWNAVRSVANANFAQIRYGLAWSGALWVAGGGTFFGLSTTASTSPDGTTWTDQPLGFAASQAAAGYGNGRFVTAGGTAIHTSTDGSAWGTVFSAGAGFTDVIYGNTGFVVVGSGGQIVHSADGTAWSEVRTAVTPNLLPEFLHVVCRDGVAVAIGVDNAGQNVIYRRHPATRVWEEQNAGTTVRLNSLKHLNGQWYACGGTNTVITSADGITWTPAGTPPPSSEGLSDIHYGNGVFVVLSIEDSYATADFADWLASEPNLFPPHSPNLRDVRFFDGEFIAFGISTGLWRSVDGVDWALGGAITGRLGSNIFQPEDLIRAPIDGFDTFILTAQFGTFYSADGTLFNEVADGFSGSIVHGNGVFVRTRGSVADPREASPDGLHWFDAPPGHFPDDNGYRDLAYAGGGEFIGVGTEGRIHRFFVSNQPLGPAGGTVRFTDAQFIVEEEDLTIQATITVERVNGSAGAVTIDYETLPGGSATNGLDYWDVSGQLTWGDGEAGTKSFTIDVIGDFSHEGTETVEMALTGFAGSAAIGAPGAATLLIQENTYSDWREDTFPDPDGPLTASDESVLGDGIANLSYFALGASPFNQHLSQLLNSEMVSGKLHLSVSVRADVQVTPEVTASPGAGWSSDPEDVQTLSGPIVNGMRAYTFIDQHPWAPRRFIRLRFSYDE